MKKDLPHLKLTPIVPGEPAAKSAPPRHDGPPAYLRGAGRTIPHGLPGREEGIAPNTTEGEENAWERALSRQTQQQDTQAPQKNDVLKNAQAFWLSMQKRRHPILEELSFEAQEEAPPDRAETPETVRRFVPTSHSRFASLALEAFSDKARARRGVKKRKSGENPPFLSTLQGQVSVCIGVILLALAVKAVDAPSAQSVSAAVSEAVTMEVDVDQDVGRLRFVQNLFPDTVAVWFSQSAPETLNAPMDGRVEKRFDKNYPGIGISSQSPEVYACEKGRVKSVVQDETGAYTVTLVHRGDLETVYARLGQALVQEGDKVSSGEVIAAAGKTGNQFELFLQVLSDGTAIDPLPYFGGNAS